MREKYTLYMGVVIIRAGIVTTPPPLQGEPTDTKRSPNWSPNCSSQKVAIQKQLYNILIDKIPNGWNSLISRRLSDFGVESELIHDSLEFFKLKFKKAQTHLRMLFVKCLTNGWHTSSRMHEAICLPCIFGCNALPSSCLARIHANLPKN